MKVLALAHQYVPVRNAGAETMLHSMLSALAGAGHDVHVSLSMQVGPPYIHEGVSVWPRRGNKANHFPYLPGTHLLVSHLENSEAASFLGRLNGIPVVLVHHNTFDVSRKMLHFHGARVDLVVVNSEWMAADLTRWHAERELTQPATIVVRPLVNWPVGPIPGPHDRVTLVNMKESTPGPEVGAWLTKGAETFWAVAARMPNTDFLGVTGAYGQQKDGQSANVDIVDHVPADQIREQVYARTRVLLVPSNYESWGRVATEATACGIPVVCSPTPGLKENLGDAGTFVDWQDVAGYVRALQTLAMPGPYKAAVNRALRRGEEHQQMRRADEALWIESVQQLVSVPAML